MLRIEPALPMLNIEPALPMDKIEPALPMDKIEPALPMLKTLPTLRMLPTLQKLRTLNKLLALARPARRPITAPDGVRPLERMALCTAASSVFARVSLVLPNVGSLAVPSIGVNIDGVAVTTAPPPRVPREHPLGVALPEEALGYASSLC